ncbi:AraC family transcriptional regulator [Paenibacillus sp. GbtcB18]|uniref:AraC family transcriptional regulator n=1 Tax=Paenibacillus sp. GbtcB18 TaxID=2824763 RepID=UPI001C30085D|nr:AraC family transcriptional regulator [Paenibacillus sp. GbtcB18]
MVHVVARLSGYQSPKYFILVCKQKTGQTPGEYRGDHGPVFFLFPYELYLL